MYTGALLGLGLLLVQASSTALLEEKVQSVRDLIVRVAADKHEDTITRFGAIVSQGLIDMGVIYHT
jgi:26S proteasome regulatory subunit N2